MNKKTVISYIVTFILGVVCCFVVIQVSSLISWEQEKQHSSKVENIKSRLNGEFSITADDLNFKVRSSTGYEISDPEILDYMTSIIDEIRNFPGYAPELAEKLDRRETITINLDRGILVRTIIIPD